MGITSSSECFINHFVTYTKFGLTYSFHKSFEFKKEGMPAYGLLIFKTIFLNVFSLNFKLICKDAEIKDTFLLLFPKRIRLKFAGNYRNCSPVCPEP